MTAFDESNEVCQVSDTTDLPPTRLRIIGYWVDDHRPDLPDPANFIDPDWEVDERQAVAPACHVSWPCGSTYAMAMIPSVRVAI